MISSFNQPHSKHKRKLIQTKLTIGQPNDKYEQEADAMADQVMRMPQAPLPVQRKCEDCEEEQLQMKPLSESITPIVQKQSEEEEEALQMKGLDLGHIQTKQSEAASDISSALTQTKGGGSKLPEHTNQFMSNAFGADFSKVNIHTNTNAVQMNRSLNARAFTHGNDVYFNKGEYNPESGGGKHLLAHELTHVVQQGAAKGNTKLSQNNNVIQRATSLDDAKKNIKKQADRWGTDEDLIYSSIRGVSGPDRAKLKADPAIQTVLKDELSGHELWKAQLLLEYGNEAAYPPEINKLWDATKSWWGTDEKKIFDTLQGLNQAQIATIQAVPGLRNILDSELSGRDQKASDDLLSGDYAKAIKKHKDNVAFVATELTNMKAGGSSALEKNTSEWVNPTPPAKPKNKLFVLTPTHDSLKRAKVHSKKNKQAYFGDKPQFPDDSATYDAHVGSNRNIHYSGTRVAGEHLGEKIWVHDPKQRGSTTFREILIHEVQHDADRHDTEEGHDAEYKTPEESWNRYKTEFRAYWVDGARRLLSSASGSAPGTLGFGTWDNARQEAIFTHMWGASKKGTYAVWLRPNYDKDTKVYGRGFKELVHGYTGLEGVNQTNSPRVDDFFLQLDKCSKSDTDLSKTPLKELIVNTNSLNANDRATINNNTTKRLQEMMKDHLTPVVFKHVAKIINGGTLPAWANINISDERSQFKKAAKGAGIKKSLIFKTIENASALERKEMKADETILRIIFDKLRKKDLWKAQFMLEYGAMKNWPPTLTEIWKATTKAGKTDKELIRTALEKLSKPQVLVIAKIMGLDDLLSTKLSKGDLKTVNQLLKGEYADAVEHHRLNMVSIGTAMAAGLADPAAATKALFTKINDPSKAMIHGLTKTHNSAERVAATKSTGKEAFFGSGTSHPTTVDDYNSEPKNNAGIRFETSATKKIVEGTNLYVLEARNIAQADLVDILKKFSQTLPK